MRDLPSGTVSFLFTDVEGSTKLLHDLGAEEYSRVLVAHRRVLREAFAANQGVEGDTQGDAFFVAERDRPWSSELRLVRLGSAARGDQRQERGNAQSANGSLTANIAPSPGSDVTRSVPPILVTSSREM